ncbi:hypothetical protein ACMFMG_011982 [Clarireedia jacksonii]
MSSSEASSRSPTLSEPSAPSLAVSPDLLQKAQPNFQGTDAPAITIVDIDADYEKLPFSLPLTSFKSVNRKQKYYFSTPPAVSSLLPPLDVIEEEIYAAYEYFPTRKQNEWIVVQRGHLESTIVTASDTSKECGNIANVLKAQVFMRLAQDNMEIALQSLKGFDFS